MKYDYMIVGTGLFGATYACLLRDLGKSVALIEKRDVPGGNIRCEDMYGINVHKYGPHIFHTSNAGTWNFVNRFVEFNSFVYSPLANYHGELYNLPFNMHTFHQLWGCNTPLQSEKKILRETKKYRDIKPQNLEEQALSLVGETIFEKLIKEYTEKQWGRPCSELPAWIIQRLPLRFTYDNNYYNDRFQGIPIGGYNKLIDGLLQNVAPEDRRYGVDFLKSEYRDWRKYAKNLIYTGPIDEYFNFCEGHLEWRSLKFKTKVCDCPNYQGVAAVNYTSKDKPYTRIIEHKHFEVFGDNVNKNPHTIITEEYPIEWKPGCEPFYPINDKKNTELYEKYRRLAYQEKDVIFGGRLAEYKYYDMDKVIQRVFDMIVP